MMVMATFLFFRFFITLLMEQVLDIIPTTNVMVTMATLIVMIVALVQPHLGKWIHSAYFKLFRGQSIQLPISLFGWVTFGLERCCYCLLHHLLILAFKEISCIDKWKSQKVLEIRAQNLRKRFRRFMFLLNFGIILYLLCLYGWS